MSQPPGHGTMPPSILYGSFGRPCRDRLGVRLRRVCRRRWWRPGRRRWSPVPASASAAVAAWARISFGYGADLGGDVEADDAAGHEAGEVHLDGLHAFLLAGDHRVAQLAALALTDEVAHGVVGHQHLVGGHTTATLGGQQTLADDALQRAGELDLDLVAALGREHVDDAVEGLRRVVGVQRGEHEVTGLGQGQRDGDRVEVAHFAEEDDVGVFTQGAAQAVEEVVHVGADLALVDHRDLVVVQVFDRVLDGEDVHRLGLVDPVDHRRQGGALTGTGGAHDEHEPVRAVEQFVRRPRRAELLERAHAEGNRHAGRALGVALLVGVGTESTDAVETEREVDLECCSSSCCCSSVSNDTHDALGLLGRRGCSHPRTGRARRRGERWPDDRP